jgi:hypothetical protein
MLASLLPATQAEAKELQAELDAIEAIVRRS